MTKTCAVIFDIDGTLIDSVDLHAKAWVEVFAEFGHEVSFEDVRGQIGKGGDQLLPVFLSKGEREAQAHAIQARRSVIMKQRYIPQIRPFADVRALFQALLADGQHIALASSAQGDELETYKRIAGIDDLPIAETSSDDANRSKPHPDIFEAALSRLRIDTTNNVLVIGDTPYDAQAASKAGLKTVGVRCGGWSTDDLMQAGCIDVYDGPTDLLDNLRRWLK